MASHGTVAEAESVEALWNGRKGYKMEWKCLQQRRTVLENLAAETVGFCDGDLTRVDLR